MRGRLFIAHRLLLPIARVLPSRYGPLLRVRRRDFTNRAAIFGLYGREVAQWVEQLRSNDVFLDIGANAGVYSLLASGAASNGRVFAFEPNPVLFDDLRFNIEINEARNITAFNAGVSDRTGTFTLVHNPRHSGGAWIGSAGRLKADEGNQRACTVLAVAPSDLDDVREAAKDHRICIKIDVEGHELHVLRGLRDAGLLAAAAWVIVEIDAKHLARFDTSVDQIYEIMRRSEFEATKGASDGDHYDEIFVRHAQPQ